MHMSVEMITTIVGVVSMLLALAGGFGWMIHRFDARLDGVESKLAARIDGDEDKLGARIDKVSEELVEVKVAIARIEGPPRNPVSAR
jgi:hypothetical protein